jgi:pescadillo protein
MNTFNWLIQNTNKSKPCDKNKENDQLTSLNLFEKGERQDNVQGDKDKQDNKQDDNNRLDEKGKQDDKDKQDSKEKEGNNDNNKKEEEKIPKTAYADTEKEIKIKNIKDSI